MEINDFNWFPALKHIENDQRYDYWPLFLENNFLIFYCFLRIVTSCAAKSRLDGGKRVSESDPASKKTWKMMILINCVFQIFFSVTQCYRIEKCKICQLFYDDNIKFLPFRSQYCLQRLCLRTSDMENLPPLTMRWVEWMLIWICIINDAQSSSEAFA